MGKKLLVALIAFTATTFANASVLNWALSYVGAGVSADIVLTTTDTLNGDGAYTIVDVSGTRNGVAITDLFPLSGYTDEDLFPSEPFFRIGGFAYHIVGGDFYNLYYEPNEFQYFEYPGDTDLGTQVDVQLSRLTQSTRVPEPASLALFGLCAAALGFSRRKQA